jgi:hypothetical protein
MKNVLSTLLFLMVLCLALLKQAPAQTKKIEQVDTSPVAADFAPGGKVNIDVCSSQIAIQGTDARSVKVSYERSGDRTEDTKVRIEVSPSEADIRVTDCPSNNFELTIEVPKSSDLYVRAFAGQVDVHGITGSKDISMRAGQLTVDVGDPAAYGYVEASVTTGDLQAPAFEVSKSGLLRSFDHHGPGKFRLHAHVGAGQLTLR